MTEAEKERAAVVAWLREQAMEMAGQIHGPETSHGTLARIQARVYCANAIEQRYHLKEQTDGQG